MQVFQECMEGKLDNQSALLTPTKYWKGLSAIEIAYQGECYQFINNEFVQHYLTQVLYGTTYERSLTQNQHQQNLENSSSSGSSCCIQVCNGNRVAPEVDSTSSLKNEIPCSNITKYVFNMIATIIFQLTLTAFILSTRISSQVHTNLEIIVVLWSFLVLFDFIIEWWAGEMAQLDRCREKINDQDGRILFWIKNFNFIKHRNDRRNSFLLVFVCLLAILLILAPLSR